MKRVIKCSTESSEMLDLIVSDKVQRKIYGKFMNIAEEHCEAYLQGVLDLAETSNISMNGIEMLWNAIQEEGVVEVRRKCLRG